MSEGIATRRHRSAVPKGVLNGGLRDIEVTMSSSSKSSPSAKGECGPEFEFFSIAHIPNSERERAFNLYLSVP